jgi:hypothetical protein
MTLDPGSDATSTAIERRRVIDSAVWTMNALATAAALVAVLGWLVVLAGVGDRVPSPTFVAAVGITSTATVCLVLVLVARHLIGVLGRLHDADA